MCRAGLSLHLPSPHQIPAGRFEGMAVFVEIVSTGSLTTEAEHGRQAFECVSADKKVALAAGKAGSTIRRSVVQPVRPVRQGAQQGRVASLCPKKWVAGRNSYKLAVDARQPGG